MTLHESAARPVPRRALLRVRVYFLVTIGALLPALLVGGAAWARLRVVDEALLRDRLRAARAVAAHLDEELTTDLELLQRVAASPQLRARGARGAPFDFALASERYAQGERAAAREALHEAYLRFHFPAGLFWLSAAGEVLLEEPPGPGLVAVPTPGTRELAEALRSAEPRLIMLPARGGARLFALVPVRRWSGEPSGMVGGALDLARRHFTGLLRFFKQEPDTTADVIDGAGVVLASTAAERIGSRPGCAAEVAKLLRARRASAAPCASCHGRERGGRGVLSFAPLAMASWGLAIAQAGDEGLATGSALPGTFFGLVGVSLLLAAIFARGAAQSITRPLAVLTGAAERLATGDLAGPIPPLGADEVGRLGAALERMRASLRKLIELGDRADLLRKVIRVQEDERKRIARELHDETSQNLAVLVMGLDAAMAAQRGGATARLEEVKALAEHALEDVHRLILDLRPSVLDDLGLLSAVRWHAERFLGTRGISVRCELGELTRPLSPELETALFRICQEAMSNIVRHSGAETVLIQVGEDGDTLRIEIEDDGKGFELGRVMEEKARRPFGLLGMKERAECVGGTVVVESAPGKGTRVRVDVPLPPREV